MNPAGKYVPFQGIKMKNREWPSKVTTQAPIWCSVCLRDGNQAMQTPMTVEHKLEFFKLLVKIGFKEIEIGFPAASETEYKFTRRLIEENLIPDDVTIQVLVQAREDLIKRTCESLVGAKRVIIHMYNSTSPAQREIVFGKTKDEILTMAAQGTAWVRGYSGKLQAGGTKVSFEYSPESFSATETDYALEVCEAVMGVWGREIIFNLPETVEVATPNIYADQVEWFCKHIEPREKVIISVHAHNDRGTGIAATELAMLAGADRVEGTLFGNGERTGNTDIVAVALNLYAQGIDPKLDFSNIDAIRKVYERCTGMTVPARQPYSGELVFTAFSGSHQDAINKGLKAMERSEDDKDQNPVWNVPYLHIDPKDLGREYDEVIRVNGQSGKGGIAYLLEHECGIYLPKDLQREFGAIAGKEIDQMGREVTANELKDMFMYHYVNKVVTYRLKSFRDTDGEDGCYCYSTVEWGGNNYDLAGKGNGPIDAFICSMRNKIANVRVVSQFEHALGEGEKANAISYVQLQFLSGKMCWGAGVDTSIQQASIRAVISALNRECHIK